MYFLFFICKRSVKENNLLICITFFCKCFRNVLTVFFSVFVYPENPINMRGYSGVCNVNYVKIGCFKDKKNDRALSQELFQDLSSGDPNYRGENVDWSDYSTYLKG